MRECGGFIEALLSLVIGAVWLCLFGASYSVQLTLTSHSSISTAVHG